MKEQWLEAPEPVMMCDVMFNFNQKDTVPRTTAVRWWPPKDKKKTDSLK